MSPARWAAYRALAAVREGADLATALARARARLDDERDRALAGEIALGVFRWLAALDHAISHRVRPDVARLDPEILDVLRVGAYQILYLERVPARAAISDAVEMARRVRKASAAGLMNAVLRGLDRERDRLPFPDRDQPLDYLSVTLSHPRWLAARWLSRYGFEATERWVRFDNAPAPMTVRANRLRIDRDALARRLAAHAVETEPTRFAPDGLVTRRGNPLATPIAREGLFFVQDEASQLVAVMAGARPGERILDACASPGGKTTAMAAAMGDVGLIVASDVRPRRMKLLGETIRAAGARTVRLVQLDVGRPLPLEPIFDAVLVDAPCSGLGTIRRDPDIRWRRREEDLASLARNELSMLRHAADAVKPGGRLVYATCSSEPEENDDIVEALLESRPDFARRDPRRDAALVPGLASVAPLLDERGALRTLPFAHGLEAFFAVILVRVVT